MNRLQVKAPSMLTRVNDLSGGNQQKVVFAKWLMRSADVYILDEPTRGIDVGAKEEIYKLIDDLARAGKAVIVISSELPELIGVSDRILVMYNGRIQGELQGAKATEKNIIEYATGVRGA
jgi:ABC-type sugar transport system ATPase subunit